jgi:hypothetical protein
MERQEAVDKLYAAGQTDEVAALAKTAAERVQPQYDAIEADDRLTDEAKTEALASIWARADDELTADLVRRAERVVSTDKSDAHKVYGVEGLPGDAASLTISMRDASQRVAELKTNEELRSTLEQATRVGDEVLARAVVQKAIQHGVVEVVNAFAADRPDLVAPVQRLWKVQRSRGEGAVAITMALSRMRPSRLRGKRNSQLRTLAGASQ